MCRSAASRLVHVRDWSYVANTSPFMWTRSRLDLENLGWFIELITTIEGPLSCASMSCSRRHGQNDVFCCFFWRMLWCRHPPPSNIFCTVPKRKDDNLSKERLRSLNIRYSHWRSFFQIDFFLLLLPLSFVGQVLHICWKKPEKPRRLSYFIWLLTLSIKMWLHLHESCSIHSIHSMNSVFQTNSWPVKIPDRGF